MAHRTPQRTINGVCPVCGQSRISVVLEGSTTFFCARPNEYCTGGWGSVTDAIAISKVTETTIERATSRNGHPWTRRRSSSSLVVLHPHGTSRKPTLDGTPSYTAEPERGTQKRWCFVGSRIRADGGDRHGKPSIRGFSTTPIFFLDSDTELCYTIPRHLTIRSMGGAASVQNANPSRKGDQR